MLCRVRAERERGATRITLLATRRSERRGEKEECGVAEENIDFRGSRPGEKRIANEDKQLRSEWAIAIAEMGAREHGTWVGEGTEQRMIREHALLGRKGLCFSRRQAGKGGREVQRAICLESA